MRDLLIDFGFSNIEQIGNHFGGVRTWLGALLRVLALLDLLFDFVQSHQLVELVRNFIQNFQLIFQQTSLFQMRNEIHLGWNLVFAFSDGYLLILLNLFVSLFIAIFISYLLHILHLLILGGSLDG